MARTPGNNQLTIGELTESEIKSIHQRYMKEAFPPSELKPVSNILNLKKKGVYFCYGLFADGNLVGYSFYFRPVSHAQLLDYYAMLPQVRSQGYGSAFLQLFARQYPEIITIAEVENPAATKDRAEADIRRRRVNFYERNGFRLTGVFAQLFGVEYAIMAQNAADAAEDEILTLVKELYQTLFPFPVSKMKRLVRVYKDSSPNGSE